MWTWILVIGAILVVWTMIGWIELGSARSTNDRKGFAAFLYGILCLPAFVIFVVAIIVK